MTIFLKILSEQAPAWFWLLYQVTQLICVASVMVIVSLKENLTSSFLIMDAVHQLKCSVMGYVHQAV